MAAAKNTRDTDIGDVLKLCLTQILSPTQSGTPAKNTDRRDLDFLTFAFPIDAILGSLIVDSNSPFTTSMRTKSLDAFGFWLLLYQAWSAELDDLT